jgi:hypothetical protein
MLKRRDPPGRRNVKNPHNPGRPGKEEVMTGRRARWMRVLPTATLTVMPFTVFGPTAQAFFPPITPTQPPPTIVEPPAPPIDTPTVPTVPPPPFVPPPVPPTPQPPDRLPPPPPTTVPEPSTLVGALAGLAAVAGWATRRKKADGQQSEK